MKNLLFLFFFMVSINVMNGQEKATLMYFGDPMCSWCYGFSEELNEALNILGDDVDFELVMGGLRPYNTETMTELKEFLTDHWNEVNSRTGQKFSYDILEENEMKYDTEPACRAVVTMREMHPELVYDYFKGAQHAFYFQNKNPNLASTFVDLAAKQGVDKEAFRQKYESDEMKAAVRQDFTLAAEIGATSFPTLILKKDETYYLISRGYGMAEVVVKSVRKVLEGEN